MILTYVYDVTDTYNFGFYFVTFRLYIAYNPKYLSRVALLFMAFFFFSFNQKPDLIYFICIINKGMLFGIVILPRFKLVVMFAISVSMRSPIDSTKSPSTIL